MFLRLVLDVGIYCPFLARFTKSLNLIYHIKQSVKCSILESKTSNLKNIRLKYQHANLLMKDSSENFGADNLQTHIKRSQFLSHLKLGTAFL